MSSTDAQNVTAAVRRFVATHQLRLGDGILVAFSGGPDSCALLFALAELRRETDFPLHAACIDHDLRPRSEMEPELEAVSKLCRRAGVPLTVLAAAPGAIRAAAHRRGIGLEAAAREQRYRLLGEARRSLRLRYVATGHQREDQEETLFMRFLQGGVLTGIAPVRGSRIRPLLEVERADIDLYLRSLGVDAVRDSSNSNEQFLRNRIRRRTLPQLRAEYPGLRRAMEQLRERETLTEDFLDQAARRRIAWRRVGGGVCTSTDAFFAAPAAVRLRALYQGLAAMPKRTRESVPSRLPYRFLRPIAVAAGPDGAHLQDGLLLSGHGLELRVRAGCLFWGLHIVQPGKRGYLLSVPEDGTAVWHVERSRIAAEWGSREQRADSARRRSANSYVVAGQELHPPLVLRGRLPGDELPTDAGTKSVKRLLAGFKVPVPLRDLVPVLEDSQGIVALIAAPFGGKNIGRSVVDRSKAGDRVLRLTISRNEE